MRCPQEGNIWQSKPFPAPDKCFSNSETPTKFLWPSGAGLSCWGRKRRINIWHINSFSVTPVTDPPGRVPDPPGRVPGRKCLCSLCSAHSTVGRTPPHPGSLRKNLFVFMCLLLSWKLLALERVGSVPAARLADCVRGGGATYTFTNAYRNTLSLHIRPYVLGLFSVRADKAP